MAANLGFTETQRRRHEEHKKRLINLPKLYSYGYVTMVVNDTMATFEGELLVQ